MLFALQMDAACLGKRRPPLAIEEGTASTCVELQIATSDIPDILGGGQVDKVGRNYISIYTSALHIGRYIILFVAIIACGF